MGFLRLLAAGRTAVLDGFFSGLTYFGSELAFMAAALLMFWCIDKRQGYYVFLVGAFGTICNQFLKLAFRIPRPWVLDPEFQIVEAARADATGYSFPSGHTQNIVGTTASLFACRKEKWVRIVCAVLMVLVPFSRMYLGVHTPLDVGVSFVLALALAAALYPAFRTEQTAKKATPWILLGAAALCGGYLLYASAQARCDWPAGSEDCCFTCPLKTHHHNDCYFIVRQKFKFRCFRTHKISKFFINYLYYHLARCQTVKNILPYSPFCNCFNELFYNFKTNVSFKQSHLNFFKSSLNIIFCQSTLTT